MTVNVAPGEVWVPGSSSATQSGYYCRVTSSTSLAVAASDPSNPRVDRVSAVVTDAAYSGATNTFAVAVETGTPTVGATLVNLTGAAAAPASSYTLGYVFLGPRLGFEQRYRRQYPRRGGGCNGWPYPVPWRGDHRCDPVSYEHPPFTTLGTPDQVTGIVLPASGLITVWYEATWQSSVSTAGSAAIFIGASQLVTSGGATPPVQAATTNGTANNAPLHSVPYGLTTVSVTAYTGDATTGQAIGDTAGLSGGPCWIFAAALARTRSASSSNPRPDR